MKEKISLFTASLLMGLIFGLIPYFTNITHSTQELIIHSLVFGFFVFVFEIFIRPLINKYFKKQQ